ncbi:zinc knuckle CX2CX4HX4C containing protein [Tanacetum coccineum]
MPDDSGFELTAFSDADHAGCLILRSIMEGLQALKNEKEMYGLKGLKKEALQQLKQNPGHYIASVDINTKSTSYVGVAGASAKDQPTVNSNFRHLVADHVFDGVNIYIPRKVVKKVSTRFEHTLYGYFIGKRMTFPVVEYCVRNNWAKHRMKRIMMNTKGFFFFKFDSWAGLEAVLEGGPWLIRNSLIFLKKWSMDTRLLKEELTRILIWVKFAMCNDSWGRSSFARCLIEVNSEADLVDVVTIGILSLIRDGFTKETIRVDPPIVTTSNVVTPTVEKNNDGFQTVGKKKKRKGKSKSTNGGQFVGLLVKQNVRYEPKAATSEPKKGATNVGNASKSSSMLKSAGTSSKKGNITTSNSYSALENEEEEDEEHVKMWFLKIDMADEEEYESDPEQAKLSLKMRRRAVASDDEDDDDNDDDVRVSSRVSDYESDEQGAPDDYNYNDGDDDDVADEELVEVVEKVVEREEGESVDGEEVGEGGEKKANEPFAVPTAGAFYMHDDRSRNSSGGGGGRNR